MAVILATCAELPDGDEDAPFLDAALASVGVSARWQSWTDEGADWTAGLVVLRSTWDYATRRDEFLEWARSVPRLVNPYDLVAWNTDKTYLVELADCGVPTVPTECFTPGTKVHLSAAREIVIKPSVGAGSRGAGRFTPARITQAYEHAAALQAAGRTVIAQPYLDGVDAVGETALIYVDGEFSHAISKGPMLPAGITHPVEGWDLFVEERITSATASAAEREVGELAVAFLAKRGDVPLYTRVDLLPSPDGPLVGELEVTEPSLFLQFADGAADRFARAIASRL
jgi:hypothetical protein